MPRVLISLCVTSFCFEEITVGFLSCSVFILSSFCLHKVVDPCWVMDLKDFINEIFLIHDHDSYSF